MTPDTTPRSPDEAALLDLASKRLPGGVLGTSRHRDELAFVVKRAQGARLWDWSGREYIDYLLGSGPMFLGHAHPAVTRAVTEQLENGTTYLPRQRAGHSPRRRDLPRGAVRGAGAVHLDGERGRPSSRCARRARSGSATRS